jgi:competence protein ComEC
MGGLSRILSRFPVVRLWTSGDSGRNPAYDRLLELARAGGVEVPVPRLLGAGGLSIEPLGPWVADTIAPPPGISVNDASLVLAVRFAGRTVLLTGDLESQGEDELVARGALGLSIESAILKVPHHGSRTSSSDALLDATRPSLAVISLGLANRFGFPRPEVLARYAARGVRVLRTDLHGAITVSLAPSGAWRATCARDCR